MKLDLEEIEACVSMLVQHARQRGLTHVDSTKYDLYWQIPSDERVDFTQEPPVATGSLRDDISEVRNLLAEPSRASVVDFERIASILCLLSRTLQDSPGYNLNIGDQRRAPRGQPGDDAMDISLQAEDAQDAEQLIAVVCIGVCAALKNGTMSINEAENRLFSPATISTLEQMGLSDRIVELIRLGTELEDIESLIPDRLNAAIDELKDKAIEVLEALPSRPLPRGRWVTGTSKP